MASDVKIKVTEMKYLKQEIEQEIEQVEALLQKVVLSCQASPKGEIDTFWEGVQDWGRKVDESWTQLCNTMRKVMQDVMEGIEKYFRVLEEVMQKLKNARTDA